MDTRAGSDMFAAFPEGHWVVQGRSRPGATADAPEYERYDAGAPISVFETTTELHWRCVSIIGAAFDGSAMWLSGADLNRITIENVIISDTGDGENNPNLMYTEAGAGTDVSYLICAKNQAYQNGGCLTATKGAVGVSHSEFRNNDGGINGGAIQLNTVAAANPADLTVVHTRFIGNRAKAGGSIFLSSATIATVRSCSFEGNVADVTGGAIAAHMATITIILSLFIKNQAASLGAALHIDQPFSIEILDTAFEDDLNDVEDGALVVFIGGRLAGCDQHPCDAGHSCSYSQYSLSCTPCPLQQYSTNGLQCASCPGGKGPMQNQSGCVQCGGNTFSAFGVCENCPGDSIASQSHTGCSKCPANQLAFVAQTDRTEVDGRRRLRVGSEGGTGTGTSGASTTNVSIGMGEDGGGATNGWATAVTDANIDAQTPSVCGCAAGFYSTDLGVKCHTDDYSVTEPALLGCETCDDLECVTGCRGQLLNVTAGWTLEWRLDGSISIFECQHAGACPGGVVSGNASSSCAQGYTGRLCGVCEKNYTSASDGECNACGTRTWLGIVICIAAIVVLAVLATKVRIWFNNLTLFQDALEFIGELQSVKSVVKIVVALGQIVGGLGSLLNVSMPPMFRDFVGSVLSVFRFDITEYIGIGCFSDGNYLTSLFLNFALVMVVALLVGAIYMYQVIQLTRNPLRDVNNNSPKGKERMQRIFARFDKDGNGIDYADMQKIVENIDPSPDGVSTVDTAALFKSADTDGSGIIDYQEFSDAVSSTPLDLRKLVKREDVSDVEQVRNIFEQFDGDGNGKIELAEIRAIVEEIDPSISTEEADTIFRKADVDNSGAIDFKEFFAAITRPAMDLRILAGKAEKADINAAALGRMFLLGFLLYPGECVRVHLRFTSCWSSHFNFLMPAACRAGMTAKIFQVFACRELGKEPELPICCTGVYYYYCYLLNRR
jgi:predicted outer membrane repeat protein